MWILVVLIVLGIIGMVLEGIADMLQTGADISVELVQKIFKGSLTTKIILTIIVIAIALYVIYEFIWDNLILVTLIKLCAVAVVVLVAIKIIKLIFSK